MPEQLLSRSLYHDRSTGAGLNIFTVHKLQHLGTPLMLFIAVGRLIYVLIYEKSDFIYDAIVSGYGIFASSNSYFRIAIF